MKMMTFLLRLAVTVIVAFPVVYWSWDAVRATTADDIMLAVLIIDAYGLMLTLLFCFVNALTKLLQHDNESS
ncbi:conjugal transfer protein TrbE [Salmonella enterica subsp. enterica serovar Bovismorbificans]|uniref:Conjugal transfer protein TrbE n=4 Tax=Salmonella enterica TaxID=28901 RepID=A0A5Y5JX34_SALER|nr:conjugal transfer protein TrbE [Salmonella enterica]ECR2244393.1 conjugal transfer protein TrbE [Salmonella enterica subsp. enterica]ECX5976689.1 conjugal transfer protein TrbE [Salmonella enterica subsp. enterica serovar Montevideo]EIG1170527.1 conjugal transfer protein TrbE [Salmonella enterica subsp. diarizonae serovar 48:k:z53]HAU3320258.1 conjugal transfer protein TrbE [Salmonella enterica subsp. diarizonae]HBJ9000803.1 conjugal transfer protein TrbE [Salmonella enterica subsp. enteric